jgi:hypothetical protein
LVFPNWSFNSRHVILYFSFHCATPKSHFACLLSGTTATICKSQCDIQGVDAPLNKIGLNEGAFGGWLTKNPDFTHHPNGPM